MSGRRHRWNKRGRWGSYPEGDRRNCQNCGMVAEKARNAGWELGVPGTTCWRVWRRLMPPCFLDSDGGARRAVSWTPEPRDA